MGVRGADGKSIDEACSEKLSSYRSMFVPGIPNFFLMLGPNSTIGNYSLTYISEVQADYCLKRIDRWRRGGLVSLDAKPEAAQTFIEYIKKGTGGMVWTSGCDS